MECNHAGALISNFQPAELWNKLLLFISYLVWGILSKKPEQTKTKTKQAKHLEDVHPTEELREKTHKSFH